MTLCRGSPCRPYFRKLHRPLVVEAPVSRDVQQRSSSQRKTSPSVMPNLDVDLGLG